MIAQESKKYLNPTNRTITTSFILPLILENKDVLFNKYGFVNAFLEDVNYPWLDNHIFILYKTSSISDSIEDEMRANKYYYDTKSIKIDNEFYQEYIFIVPPQYKDIISNFKEFSYDILTTEDKIKILKFWDCFDFPHIKQLIEKYQEPVGVISELKEIIPEEDPVDEYNDTNSKYFLQRLGFNV